MKWHLQSLIGLLLSSPLAAQEWRSGDPHVHMQTCNPPDLSLAEIQLQAKSANLDFVGLQLWSKFADLPGYLSLAPLITGGEAAPGTQFGLEVSGFLASQFGHLQILNASDGAFPVLSLHPAPILAYYDSAVTGYAHVRWAESYAPVPFFGGVGGAYMAPIDAALRSIDFIETMEVEWDTPTTWRGMYYKLQSSGLRVGLAAGSDNTCGSQDGIGNPRTWAQAATYEGFCQEIAAGRTSISDSGSSRLDLEVASGLAVATLHGPAGSGVLRLLANGSELASEAYSTSGEDVVLVAPLPRGSAWIAARGLGVHTAAAYSVVGDEPIAVAQDAAYWRDYCDAFLANLSVFSVQPAETEIIPRIQAARDIYAASYARSQPWPAWASEYGVSTPSAWGPISIGLTAAGKPDCLAAPSSSPGWLIVGVAPASLPISGITLLVSPSQPYALVPVATNAGGYAKALLNVPSGKHYFAQFIWPKPGGGLCASDGLDAVAP